jgi:NADPH-dependent curcumin reductase CurA
MTTNAKLVLRERPLDRVEDTCFERIEEPVKEPAAGEILVKTCWLEFAPAQRGWLNDIPSYVPPVALGEVMRARGVGQVVQSNHPDFAAGDLVEATLGWQTWAVLSPSRDDELAAVERIPPDISDPKLFLSVLGSTGLTAYFGMRDIGRPEPADTVLVTAAAGAVGSIAGQNAKNLGAKRVIGTASTEEKRAWVRDVAGFDECIDYRAPHLFRQLREAAPDGFDVVFDNVGGTLLDLSLGNLAIGARIVLCGSISTGYRPERPEVGLRNYQFLTTRRARMEGFIVLDSMGQAAAARAEMQRWITEGRLHWAEDMAEGIENAPSALRRLFDGQNLGKQLLHVADPD